MPIHTWQQRMVCWLIILRCNFFYLEIQINLFLFLVSNTPQAYLALNYFMKSVLLVGLGGAIGSIARYLVGLLCKDITGISFPINTFLVNMIGCFCIGLLSFQLTKNTDPDNLRLFAIVGVLGGFTTFSSFSIEVINMFREKFVVQALLYVLVSNVLGIFAAYMGYSFKS